jgi:hypothetical protein
MTHETTFHRNSLHYRIATFYGRRECCGRTVSLTEHTDFCTYSTYFFRGLWNLFLIVLFSALGAGLVADTLAWLAAMFATGSYIVPDMLAIMFLCFVGLFMLIATAYYGDMLLKKIGDLRYEYLLAKYPGAKRPPGFWKLLKKQLKEKVCFQIKIED